MKLCILSMQRVPNFGSVLQCYALKKMLESLGHTVSFLDIAPNAQDHLLLEDSCRQSFNEGEVCGSVSSKLKKLDRYALNRIQQKILWKLQEQKFQRFRCCMLPEAKDEDGFDCCIIGSDEVFNCLAHAPWGFTSQLFGNVPQARSVITYAASCGGTVFSELPLQAAERIRESMANLSALSVRDENTRDFVSTLASLPAQMHSDPVLVADFSREIGQAVLPAGLPKRYCLVYSYYNRICDGESIRQIRDFCSKRGLHLLTVGAPQKWIPDHRVLMPFETLKLFQNAEFVITDTFHGTIFSAKYASRFAVMIRSSNRNKLADLVKKLALEPHVVDSFAELEAAYSVSNDPGVTAELAAREYRRTMAYLTENISET